MELEPVPLSKPEHILELNENLAFYTAAIGYRNTDFYLRHFKRFDTRGPALTWNWAAVFPTFIWFIYRRMWGWALLYLLLPVMFTVVVVAVAPTFPAAIYIGVALYLALVLLLFPLLANLLYYGHVKRKVASIKRLVAEREVRLRMIAADGGTNARLPSILAMAGFAAGMVLFVAYAVPEYQHYLVRHQVSKALVVGSEYQRMVEAYAVRNRQLPRYESELSAATRTHQPPVRGVVVNNGVIFILLTGNQQLEGKTLAFLPSRDTNGGFRWECRGIDIADYYLPAHCRRKVNW